MTFSQTAKLKLGTNILQRCLLLASLYGVYSNKQVSYFVQLHDEVAFSLSNRFILEVQG